MVTRKKLKFICRCLCATSSVMKCGRNKEYLLVISNRPEIKPIVFTEYKHIIHKNIIKINSIEFNNFEDFFVYLFQYYCLIFAKNYSVNKPVDYCVTTFTPTTKKNRKTL